VVGGTGGRQEDRRRSPSVSGVKRKGIFCTADEDLKMYPVIPMEMNRLAADSLLYLIIAVSVVLSVVCSLR
jgi:hypothetical protein